MNSTILVDMDGVLVKWEEGFVRTLKMLHPHITPVEAADRRGFYVHMNYPEEHHASLLDVMEHPSLYADLDPMDDAVSAMNDMLDSGLDVAICTSPYLKNSTCASAKLDWVVNHLGQRWGDRVVITRDKTRVQGAILVDDKATITGALNPSWQHVIFDAPYNREVTDRVRLTQWSEWQQVLLPLL